MKTWRIDTKRFSGIAEGLYETDGRLRSQYPYDYRDPSDGAKRIAWLDSHPGADRHQVADALALLNRELGADAAAMAAVAALRDGRSLAVVTGQQTGLFTGPLYTLYKAATVIKRARALAHATGRPVIPIFWMATEDHDFAEIAMNWQYDSGKVKTVRLGREHKGNQPVGQLPITPAVKDLLTELTAGLAALPHGQSAKTVLTDSLAASDTIGDWFGRLLLKLFAGTGLVVLDPCQPELRRVMTPFFDKALTDASRVREAFAHDTDTLSKLGYTPEAALADQQTGLFMVEAGERIPLYLTDDGALTDRSGAARWGLSDLRTRAAATPEAFSTGVVLRPVLQDWLLPVVETVLGPGETAYHGQLTGVYTLFDRQMPILVPRESWVLVPGGDPADLDHLPELIAGNPEEWTSDRLLTHWAPGLKEQMTTSHGKLAAEMATVIEALPIGAEAKGQLSQRAVMTAERSRKELLRQVRRALTSEVQDGKRWLALSRMVRPNGKQQERMLLPWYFYGHFGEELISTIVESPFSESLRGLTGGTSQ